MSLSEAKKKVGGLAGVVAGSSAICTCGLGNGLNYYGYSIEELANEATFEEVAYLLQFAKLPNKAQLKDYQEKIAANTTTIIASTPLFISVLTTSPISMLPVAHSGFVST